MRRIRRHRDFFTRDGEWATTSATRAHRSRRLRGLGRRLTITFLAVTLLVAGTASCLFFLASRGRMISERSVSLLTQANMVASGVSAGGGDLAAVQALLRTRSREAGARLVLLDVNGRVVADSAAGGAYPSLIGELVTDDLVDVALGGGQETSLRYLEGVGHAMYGAVPVVRGGEITGVLLASRAADDMVAAVAGLTRQLAIYLGASLVAVALAAAALGHHLTAPLRKLTRAAERLGEGVLTERVNLERDDEIGRLGRTFDLMAGQCVW